MTGVGDHNGNGQPGRYCSGRDRQSGAKEAVYDWVRGACGVDLGGDGAVGGDDVIEAGAPGSLAASATGVSLFLLPVAPGWGRL